MLSKSMARPTASSAAGRTEAADPEHNADADAASLLRFGLRPRYTCILYDMGRSSASRDRGLWLRSKADRLHHIIEGEHATAAGLLPAG